jgi:GNAT superfamily N-acetyltransferase
VSVAIAPLGPADFHHWDPLWQGYLAFYKTSLSDDVTRLTFRRLTSPDEPMGGFLALADGRAVGMVNWIRHRSCWTAGDYCYLQDLFVDPQVRGGGIGRQLIEAVYDTARSQGCSRVHWLTHETNTDAMKLYDHVAARSGFVQYRKLL